MSGIGKRKKLGLCLGAGGARGIAHVGFLQAITEAKIDVHAISGCSMGSLVGAAFLDGYSPKKMQEIAAGLTSRDVIDFGVSAFKRKSLLRGEKMAAILKELFGDDDFCDLRRPFACTAADLYSGGEVVFTSGSIREAVRASCSIPIAFPPVESGDMILVDGGICNKLPVAACRKLGADVVVAVDVLGEMPKAEKLNNLFAVAFRAFDVMGVNVSRSAVAGAECADLLVSPDLGNANQYKVENQDLCFRRGYEAACSVLPDILALLD